MSTWSKTRLAISLIGLTVALSLARCGGSTPSSQQQTQSQPTTLATTVDAVVQAEIQQHGELGMTIAVAKNGTMLYVQGYGVTDLGTRQATQPSVIFEIGSVTKQFTAALIVKLQEQGLLHVDDSLASYLPEYSFPPAITIRMLLTHTSGLANFTDFPQLRDWIRNGVSEATVLTAVSQAALLFPPGTKYSYSNSNFFALGTIIERVTGQSYPANLEQYIFHPLSLANTYYVLPPANQSATGYANNGSGLVPTVVWDRSAAFAAGALSSNVYDLVAWDNALTHGKVVSPDSFKAMTTSNGFVDSSGSSYGFGLVLSKFNGRQVMWHNGQIGGFCAETAVLLDSGFTVILLTNDQDVDTDAVVVKLMSAVCNSSQLSGNC